MSRRISAPQLLSRNLNLLQAWQLTILLEFRETKNIYKCCINFKNKWNYRGVCEMWFGVCWQCRKLEGNLAEASASSSCGGGPGGLVAWWPGGLLFICLFVCLFIFKFSRGSCLGCLNAIYGPVLVKVYSTKSPPPAPTPVPIQDRDGDLNEIPLVTGWVRWAHTPPSHEGAASQIYIKLHLLR